jgi:hypothetical protein
MFNAKRAVNVAKMTENALAAFTAAEAALDKAVESVATQIEANNKVIADLQAANLVDVASLSRLTRVSDRVKALIA